METAELSFYSVEDIPQNEKEEYSMEQKNLVKMNHNMQCLQL